MATDEDMEDVQVENKKRASVGIDSVKRKKFKADDLPLSGAQHAAIDKLLHSFKKKGGFDSVRKKIWAEFNEGVCYAFAGLIADIAHTFHAGLQNQVYRPVDCARRVRD
jgi:hypothetical protein